MLEYSRKFAVKSLLHVYYVCAHLNLISACIQCTSEYVCTSACVSICAHLIRSFVLREAVLIKHRKAQTSQVNVFGVCSHACLCARARSPESNLHNVLQVRFLNDSM